MLPNITEIANTFMYTKGHSKPIQMTTTESILSMSEPAEISVILPVRNGERYLKSAIESILNQTYPHFKLLVLDDGSDDRSLAIATSFNDARLIVLSQEPQGVAMSLNRLIMLADTKYIARQDADDISHPQRFEMQHKFLERNPDIGLLGTFAEKIDSYGKKNGEMTNHVNHKDIKDNLHLHNQFVHGSVMYRRAACLKAGAYNEIFSYGQDYEFWFRLTRMTKAANLGQILYYHRIHPQQITNKKAIKHQQVRNFIRNFSANLVYDRLYLRGRNNIEFLILILDSLEKDFARLKVFFDQYAQQGSVDFGYLFIEKPQFLINHIKMANSICTPEVFILFYASEQCDIVSGIHHDLNACTSVQKVKTIMVDSVESIENSCINFLLN